MRKNRTHKKGFALIEVLIAIAILAIVAVPLAANMIASARLNSQAKNIGSASDISTSMLEVMQTVDLSDILTDINGYSTDQYGAEIPYQLGAGLLKEYAVGQKVEVIRQDDGTFVPVIKREDVDHDYESNASIITRYVGAEGEEKTVKSYFVGQDSGNYAFLLKNVENNDMNVDILTTITPLQTGSIANITSMQQTDIIFVKQDPAMNQAVAKEFDQKNNLYRSTDGSVIDRSEDWYLRNMKRTITIDMEKDMRSDAVTITISAVYSVDGLRDNGVREGQGTFTKQLGSFSTNSTAEFAKGIFLYYSPLFYDGETSDGRDTVVINNMNELAVPVYLIAVDNSAENDMDYAGYKPALVVNELSTEVYQDQARTTVCSNIPDAQWSKTLTPGAGRTLTVKTLGNNAEQQTLYSVNIAVYNHRDGSFNEDGVFQPREKDILITTDGTILDTSELMDIDNDTTTGITPTPGQASVWKVDLTYNGEEQTGVQGSNVVFGGTISATDAGTYTATATPARNFVWADGTNGTKTITWTIKRARTAEASGTNKEYNKELQSGIASQYVELSGTYQAVEAGNYIAIAKPDSNHAWADGTYAEKQISWRIFPKTVTIEWGRGPGMDIWEYDGNIHYGSFTISGIFPGDACSANASNITIRDVGTKTATINGLSNKNYALPTDGSDRHVLTVTAPDAASITLGGETTEDGTRFLIYNGRVQNIVESYKGVVLSGDYTARNVREDGYTFTAKPKQGYTWEDGSTTPRSYTWFIQPKEVGVVWGTLTWTYDGLEHSTTCTAKGLEDGDTCGIYLRNNSIRDAGSVVVEVNGWSNPNYKITADEYTSAILTVNPAPLASFEVYDFQYDGEVHTGVVGKYITYREDSVMSHTEVNTDSNGLTMPYTVYVQPAPNYTWAADFDLDAVSVEDKDGWRRAEWKILPILDSLAYPYIIAYDGLPQECIRIENATSDPANGYIQSAIGRYTVKVTPLKNHAWVDLPDMTEEDPYVGSAATREITFEIKEASIFKPSFESYEYEYNGESISPKMSLFSGTGFESGFYFVEGSELSATNAGTYTITARLREGKTWEDGSTNDVVLTWKIVPKPLQIDWHNNQWIYDKAPHEGKANPIGICGDDVCEFTYYNNTHTDAGEYQFVVSGTTNPNYVVDPEVNSTSTMIISKRPVGIVWSEPRTFVYSHENHAVTAYASNVMDGDTVNLVVSNGIHQNVGTYQVEVTDITGDTHNYYLPTANRTTTMEITRQADASFSITGNPTYNGSEQTVGMSSHGVSISGTTRATNVNEFNGRQYAIQVTPDANHTWPDGSVETKTFYWTMLCKQITASAKSGLVYNGSKQVGLSYTAGQATPSGTYQATNAGSYVGYLTPTRNYKWSTSIAGVGGTQNARAINWSIAKANAVVTKAPTGKTLNANGSAQTLINAGTASGGTLYYRLSGTSWSTSLPKATEGGTYTVYYYVKGDTNHNSTEERSVKATIKGLKDASYTVYPRVYTGGSQECVTLKNAVVVSINSSHGTKLVTWNNSSIKAVYWGTKYTVVAKPASGHLWTDGSSGQKTFTFIINANPIASMTVSATAYTTVYDSTRVLAAPTINSSHVTVGGKTQVIGTPSAIRGKSYVATGKPKSGYAWSNGSMSTKSFTWKVLG